MQCLIVGYGSIGKRHAQVLNNLGCEISLVTSQKVEEYNCYSHISDAIEKKKIEYVIIANSTHLHYATLLSLIECDYRGVVLVEKPLFSKEEFLTQNNFKKILVAYNLRFCDLLNEAKALISNDELITFSVYVGSYLPAWRKNIDYRNCYSAKKDQGGGVIRDLSHELDYTNWFCGASRSVAALGGHFSSLEIDSDDVYSILMKSALCPSISLHLNYLDRHTRREIVINTNQKTISIDLVKGVLSLNGEIRLCSEDRSLTYVKQLQAMLNGEYNSFCTYEEGLYLMKLIETIEKANASQIWMNL